VSGEDSSLLYGEGKKEKVLFVEKKKKGERNSGPDLGSRESIELLRKEIYKRAGMLDYPRDQNQ